MKKTFARILTAVLVCLLLVGVLSPAAVPARAEEAAASQVYGWNLVLADEIAVNFLVDISDTVSADAVMNVTDGYGTTAHPIAEAERNAAGQYLFTAHLAAAQLADDITLELVSDGQIVSTERYKAVDYANTVLAGDYSTETKALVGAMLHYGAAAQTYFDYNTDNLANAGLTAGEVDMPQWTETAIVSGSVPGVQFYGASLVFDSRVAVRFYFKAQSLTNVSFGTYTPVEKNGMYYVEIPGINPQDYDKAVSLTVTDGSAEMTVSYSPMAYILRKYAGSEDGALKNLTAAMYQYHNTAKAYVAANGGVITDGNGIVIEQIVIRDGLSSAVVPAGTQLEENVTTLTLSATPMAETGSDVTVGENEQMVSLDVHINGISAENTVPVIVTLDQLAPEFLNQGNIRLYHVEDGVTVEMTRVYSAEELDVHNEYYYDIVTGTVTVAMASFSEIVTVADTENAWEGKLDYAWYDADATELTIYNADQLAGFGAIVGGMVGQTQDSFNGKTVKLMADISIGDLDSENRIVFYPIGYYNSEGTYEKTSQNAITSGFYTFEGTFDGNGHTISNFYQNTWEMKGDNNYYPASDQHYRDGMGLFGKVYGGTVKNLTVKNFSCDGEYTTTGTIAAYADYGATFQNITIFECNPRVYNIGNGGIVGCVGWYTTDETDKPVTFENITVDNSNKISALWGSYDVACGGIVGQYYPTSGQSSANYPANAGIKLVNCHVAARIDVYNDVCANYQYYAYRYAGILIGSVRENVTVDGHEYPKMDGISAMDCTVHFGDWNDYYYCELVANSLASYTHDHQMSRLEQVGAVEGTTITYLDGTTGTVPASGAANYVVVKAKDENGMWIHGDGAEYATCYHFVDGKVWNHAAAGEETVNGETVLKEDKQLVYREFNNLVTGYGWGVTSKGVDDMDGVTILDREEATSVKKFDAVVSERALFATGSTVSVDQLFKAAGSEVEIDNDNVQVFVSPVEENSNAGGTYTAYTTRWYQGDLTFFGEGDVLVTITDYNYCEPTTVMVTVVKDVDGYAADIVLPLEESYTVDIPAEIKGTVTNVWKRSREKINGVTIVDRKLQITRAAIEERLDTIYGRDYGDIELFLNTDEGIYRIKIAVITKKISSYADILAIKENQVNGVLGGYYILTEDIDAAGQAPICLIDWNGHINNETYKNATGESFPQNVPLNSKGFVGIFDGRGHTISNLTAQTGEYAKIGGFFGQILAGAIVRDVAFVDMTTDGGEQKYLLTGESCRMIGTMENVFISGKGDATHAFNFIGSDPNRGVEKPGRGHMRNVVVTGVDYFCLGIIDNPMVTNVIADVRTAVRSDNIDGAGNIAAEQNITVYIGEYDAIFTDLEQNNVLENWNCDITYADGVIFFNGKSVYRAVSLTGPAVIVKGNSERYVSNVTIVLKESIEGVSLADGVLTVDAAVAKDTVITLVASHIGFTTELEVQVLAAYDNTDWTDRGWLGDLETAEAESSITLPGAIEGNLTGISYGTNAKENVGTLSGNVLTVPQAWIVAAADDNYGAEDITLYTDTGKSYTVSVEIVTKAIANQEDLMSIATNETSLDGYYVVTQDFECDSTPITLFLDPNITVLGGEEPNWEYHPELGFKGTFDGRGHIISNLTTQYGGYRKLGGVFGQLCAGSVVKNVAFVNIQSANKQLLTGDGSVLYGTLENVVVIGTDSSSKVVSKLDNSSGKIVNCFFANVSQISQDSSKAQVSNVLSVTANASKGYGGFGWTDNANYNAQPNYATMDAMIEALAADNFLANWQDSMITHADGQILFNGKVIVEQTAE